MPSTSILKKTSTDPQPKRKVRFTQTSEAFPHFPPGGEKGVGTKVFTQGYSDDDPNSSPQDVSPMNEEEDSVKVTQSPDEASDSALKLGKGSMAPPYPAPVRTSILSATPRVTTTAAPSQHSTSRKPIFPLSPWVKAVIVGVLFGLSVGLLLGLGTNMGVGNISTEAIFLLTVLTSLVTGWATLVYSSAKINEGVLPPMTATSRRPILQKQVSPTIGYTAHKKPLVEGSVLVQAIQQPRSSRSLT